VLLAPPVAGRAALDRLGVERQVRRHANQCRRFQRIGKRAQHRDVAIRRFDEELGSRFGV